MHTSRLVALILASAAVLSASCTAVTDATSSQCHTQAECWSRGPEFANTTCSPERVCVPIKTVAVACTTNKQCLDASGGAPSTCRKSDGACVALKSAQCPTVFAKPQELVDDNTIFFGLSVPIDANGVIQTAMIEFAQDEVRRTTTGLPPLRPGGPRRPVAWVVCNSDAVIGGGTVQTAIAQAQHLVDVGVVASLGPLTSDSILPAATNVNIPNGVLTLYPGSVGAASFLDDKDTVFRTGFTAALGAAHATSLFDTFLATQLVADGIVPAGEKIRVAVIQQEEVIGLALSDHLSKNLRFNGMTFTENAAAGFLKVFSTGDPNDPVHSPDAFAKIPQALTGAQAFLPHVILYAGGPSMVPSVLVPMSKGWIAATSDAPFPYQVSFNPGWAGVVGGAFGGIPDVARKRYLGVNVTAIDAVPADTATLAVNLSLFKPEFTGLSIVPFGPIAYDSAYLAMYAAASLGPDEALSGANMSKAIRKLSAGTVVNWGTADLPKAFAALQAGGGIEYRGVGGTYKFDKNGDRAGLATVTCVTAPPFTSKPSKFTFNNDTQTAQGTLDIAATCGP